MFARLTQNLKRYVFRNVIFFYKAAHKIEFCVGGTRKTYFYFLETDFYKQVKEFEFLLYAHRIYKRLISVAKVYGTP